MRSLLLVPGSDEAKVRAALASAADAVVIELDREWRASDAARALLARILGERACGAPALIVRVSPLASGETDEDLEAVIGFRPFAILLPRPAGAASVQQLSAKLAVWEAQFGLEDGATRIVPAIDNAAAVLAAASFRDSSARLVALAWDAAALRAELGAEGGSEALRHARALTRLAAAAARIDAIDALCESAEALAAETEAARREGFTGKFVGDPQQAAIVNAVCKKPSGLR